jgi:hypothetical protein
MAVAYVVLAHQWPGALTLVAVTLGFLILTRAVGVAVFALLPNVLDQRGPAVGLRLLVAYALVFPAALPAFVVALISRSVTAGACAGLLASAGEAVLLIVFASWRLAGRVDRLTA